MTSQRLTEHELLFDGAPHVFSHAAYANRALGPGGRGLCTCGTWSDWASSDDERKQWHRQHKADVIGGQG